MRTIIRSSLWLCLLLVPTLVLCSRTSTPQFRDASGELIPGSIAIMEKLRVGGIPQQVWIRGVSTKNPILVLLHGGPGVSESALFRAYVPELEQKYLVVYWDQRGAGRSFSRDIPTSSITIDEFVSDLDDLVSQLTSRFGQRRVTLLGHSWGTVIGLTYAHLHPERVAAYIGVAQVADYPAAEQKSWTWALEQARAYRNDEAVAELSRIGPPPHDVDQMLTSRKWVERLGGSFYGEQSTGALIWALNSSEASLRDLYLFGRGNRHSLDSLWPELRTLSLISQREFHVPIFFLLGRHDMQVPAEVAADHFNVLQAPCKQLIWFENSGHNPPFEQPSEFVRVVNQDIPEHLRGGCGGDGPPD